MRWGLAVFKYHLYEISRENGIQRVIGPILLKGVRRSSGGRRVLRRDCSRSGEGESDAEDKKEEKTLSLFDSKKG